MDFINFCFHIIFRWSIIIYKYKMRIINLIALLSVIVSLTLSIGVAPDPYCLSKPLYKQFPLVQ